MVWNGAAQDLTLKNGKLRLTAAGYQPASLHKNERLPGATLDFTVTPFAVVMGTVSKDPDMVSLCRLKAEHFIDGWRDWQKRDPRVFKDTEITDADMAKYSLLLVGGPEANRVTSKLAAKLPLRITTDRIVIDGKEFPVKDAAVQMLYPNPPNPERYVWIAAGTSTDGMYFAGLNPQGLYDWDYIIVDGVIPAYKQKSSALQTRIISGMFDYNWRFSETLTQAGDKEIRAKGRLRHRPKADFAVNPKLLESYAGRYQIGEGMPVELVKDGDRLLVKQHGQAEGMELLPETETSFYLPGYDVWISFVQDASGKVTGLIGYQNGDFEGKKLD